MPDFFLDVGPDDWLKNPKATGAAEAPVPEAPAQTQAAPPAGSGIANTFKAMEGALNADLVKSMDASYQFNLTGKRFCGVSLSCHCNCHSFRVLDLLVHTGNTHVEIEHMN